MDNTQRIDLLKDFLNAQRYLDGLAYEIIEGDDDSFVIRFPRAAQRQMFILNRRLKTAEMHHIRGYAEELIDYQPPKFKKKKRRKNANDHPNT